MSMVEFEQIGRDSFQAIQFNEKVARILHRLFKDLSMLTDLLGRWSADPFVLADCDSALLRANQRWGSHCHAHLCYCLLLSFLAVKLICISRH